MEKLNGLIPNSRKKVLIYLLLVAGIWGLSFLFTHSLIVIKGVGPEEKNVYLHWGNRSVTQKHFTLKEDSKTFIVPKGAFTIETSSGEKLSKYQKKAKGLSKEVVDVEVVPQKKITALGSSQFDCSMSQAGDSSVQFYPCDNYQGASQIKNGSEELDVFDNLLLGLSGQDEESGHFSQTTRSLAPYGNVFLLAVAHTGKLIINYKPSLEENSKETIEVGDFQDKIGSDNFSTPSDGNNDKFSILDRNKKSLLIFDSALDKEPDNIDLSDFIKDEDSKPQFAVNATNDYVFVTVKQSGVLEDHENPGDHEEHAHDDQLVKQRVLAIDINKKAVINTYNIANGFLISDVLSSPDGKLFLLPLYPEEDEVTQLSIDSEKLKSSTLTGIVPKNACLIGNNNLYYSTVNNEVFRYDLNKQVSFLVYSNEQNSINNLQCNFNQVSFTASSSDDGIINKLVHYRLSEKDHSGGRVEWILPLYLGVEQNLIKVTQEMDSLKIEALNGGLSAFPNKEVVQLKVLEELKKNRIDTNDLQFIFNY